METTYTRTNTLMRKWVDGAIIAAKLNRTAPRKVSRTLREMGVPWDVILRTIYPQYSR